jgi:lipopolysaccharide transport system ATP-binding protein
LIRLRLRLLVHSYQEDLHLGVKLRDKFGLVVYETNTYCQKIFVGDMSEGDVVTMQIDWNLNVREGMYNVTLGISKKGFSLGSFEEQLWYAHGLAPIEVTRDKNIHLWDGITNLHPKISILCENPTSGVINE